MSLIDSGGFGCVFSPELECEKSTKPYNKTLKYIGKLQSESDAVYENKLIHQFLKRIRVKIPNYTDYFVLDNITMCTPKLSKRKLKKKYSKTCNVVKNKDKIKQLVIPFMGTNLEKYLEKHIKHVDIFHHCNEKLIQLYTNAIIPMSQIGFYHNDIKAQNILIDSKDQYRIIDFGVMNMVRYPYFSFNNPLNGILLTDGFVEYYNTYKEDGATDSDILVNYLSEIKCSDMPHYTYMIGPLLSNMVPDDITESTANIHPLLFNYYLTTIETFTPYNKNINKLRLIYNHNTDTIGFLSIYGIMYQLLIDKYEFNIPVKIRCLIGSIKNLYLKYILSIDKISYNTFINDVSKLNLCF